MTKEAADITSALRVRVRGAGLHQDLVLLALHPLPVHPDPPDRLCLRDCPGEVMSVVPDAL